MFTPTNSEHTAIIEKLTEALAALPIGGTIVYSKLSEIAGRDVSDRYRYLLVKAADNAEKQLGCIFESVRGVGVKRLTASEIPDVGLAAIRKIRRGAKRGSKRLTRIGTNSLSESENRRVVASRAMLGAIATIADGRRASTLAAVADPVKPIPPENILQMFMQKG